MTANRKGVKAERLAVVRQLPQYEGNLCPILTPSLPWDHCSLPDVTCGDYCERVCTSRVTQFEKVVSIEGDLRKR